jgi:hypothetical protein
MAMEQISETQIRVAAKSQKVQVEALSF